MLGDDAYGMIGGIMFRSPLFHDVWPGLRTAYAADFIAIVEQRFMPAVHAGHAPVIAGVPQRTT